MKLHRTFSEREEDVISLLLEGKSNKQIAQALNISISTVEFHLGNIYSTLRVSSRSEAIIKLLDDHLWESTGKPGKHELRQAIVETGDQSQENKKNFDWTWRFSMKKFLSNKTGLIAIMVIAVIVFLFLLKPNENQGTDQPTISPREQIIAEAQQLVAHYDQAIQNEMQTGEVETSTDPSSGKEIFHFKGDSYGTIATLYDALNEQLQTLNEQYLALYIADVQPTPFPTQSTETDNDNYYQELLQQYPGYFDQLLNDGPTLMIYDPDDGNYHQRLVGDAYAKSEIMLDAIQTLHYAPQMAKIDQETHMTQIREILGNPDMPLTFQGIQELANAPWVTAAGYVDDRGVIYWVAIDAGRLAGINLPPLYSVDIPAVDVKDIADVRLTVEKFASDSSLRFDELKNELLYEEGSKGDIYFFRWDYGNKDWSGTSWAMMPPFLQIGMSADGKLVTYINSLDLY